MHAFVEREGWPKKDEIDDVDMLDSRILPDLITDYEASEGFHLWGRGREIRDVDRSLVGAAQQWAMLEDGLCNYV